MIILTLSLSLSFSLFHWKDIVMGRKNNGDWKILWALMRDEGIIMMRESGRREGGFKSE